MILTRQQAIQDFYAKSSAVVRQDVQHIDLRTQGTWIYSSDKPKVYIPNPTGMLFHQDNTFVRLIMGPYGSGKSTICINEIVRLACQMPVWYHGRRRAKCLIIRNTSGELYSTTLQTWLQWFGELGHFSKRQKPLLTYEHTFSDDKGQIELELVFIALDRDEDIRKLKSIEATFAYINELSEVPQSVLHHLIGRVNHRYPSQAFCGEPYWSGIIADSNPPDEDHWIYKDFELNPTPSYKVFYQPSGLIANPDGSFAKDKQGNYIANIECDNFNNLSPDYYVKLAEKRSEGFIKVYCAGKYGLVESGKRVYPEYNDDIHSVPKIDAIQGLPIHLCWDFGLTPACIIFQLTARGQLRVLKEYVAEDMGIRTFAQSIVLPDLPVSFPYNKVGESEADPAGAASDTIMEELSCIGELNNLGIKTNPASTNDVAVRISSVRYFLNAMTDGHPAFLLDREQCPVLRKGFINGYHFKRLSISGDERYQDKPNKNRFSHCFVAETLVITNKGNMAISNLKIGDKVLTPGGYKNVSATMQSFASKLLELEFSNGSILRCTLDHPFITCNGIKRADALQYGDILRGISWRENIYIKYKNLMVLNIIKKGKDIIKHALRPLELLGICIEMFGNFIMVPFQADTISITSTTTKVTMTLKIFQSLVAQNMQYCMEKNVKVLKAPENIWILSDLLQLNGINLLREENGIKFMEKKHGKIEKKYRLFVQYVVQNLKGLKEQLKKVTALMFASHDSDASQVSIMKSDNVLSVKKNSAVTSMKKQEHVLNLVRIKCLQIRKEVYDITVDDEHCFYANGVLVGNCHDALQYGAMKFASDRVIESKKPEQSKIDMFNPVFRWNN